MNDLDRNYFGIRMIFVLLVFHAIIDIAFAYMILSAA